MTEKLIIYTDGCSKGNPGQAAIGVAMYRGETRTPVYTISDAIGITTNNQAEYRALIKGLEYAVSCKEAEVEVRSDSELIVNQMNGRYRVKKEELIPLHQEARRLAGQIPRFSIKSIPREYNAQADKLANLAIKNQQGLGES
jgi:ribonuclease HI